jgi:hypothetical protein
MPFGDATGPNGIGPTGWRRGPCKGLGARAMDCDSFRGYGRGFGRGYGRGFGYGFGRGFRGAGRFYGRDFRADVYADEFPAENYSKEERIKLLKKEKELIEEEINNLEK